MPKINLTIFNYALTNKNNDSVDIHIDGDIVDAPTQEILQKWWGDETSVSFKSFRNEIEKADPKTVNVYINSAGGHVGDAMAMHDYLSDLENKGVTVNRIGRGIIASAATYLLMGKNSKMTANSFTMIHNVSLVAYGSLQEVENQVKAARKFNDRIRDFYSEVTGKPAETISSWMNKETWFNAQEAKENGFVENILGEEDFTNSISENKWPFENKAILNTYNSFTLKNTSMAFDLKKIEGIFNTAVDNLLNKLGFQKGDQHNEAITNFGTELATAVQNAIKDETMTEEKVTTLINKSVGEFINGEDFSKKITNIVTEQNKNLVTNEGIKTLFADFKNEIIASVANKVAPAGGEENKGNKTEVNNNFVRRRPVTKYQNAQGWTV